MVEQTREAHPHNIGVHCRGMCRIHDQFVAGTCKVRSLAVTVHTAGALAQAAIQPVIK